MASDRLRRYPVILDTNAFFLPFQFKINLDSELARVIGSYDYFVPRSVVTELEGLLSGGEPMSREAMALFEHLSPEVVEGTGPADRDVVDLAADLNGALMTQDARVRKRALSSGVPVIFLRSGKHLQLQRPQPY